MVSPAMARFSSGRHEALSVRLLDDIHGSAPGACGIHLRDAEHGRGQRSRRDWFRQTSLAVKMAERLAFNTGGFGRAGGAVDSLSTAARRAPRTVSEAAPFL